ncbi:MAG TPA: hypothetical protein VK116_17120, partial [Planctomycetota bacterium]|nr:hypothetical protein [Planctomycetota bacterium]
MRRVVLGGSFLLAGAVLWTVLPVPALFRSAPRGNGRAETIGNSAGTASLTTATTALFPFADAYFALRSAWFAEVFANARASLATTAPPADGAIVAEVDVHSEPFTNGPAFAKLPDSLLERRSSIEHHAVEARALFEVPGVAPEKLVLFFAFSSFTDAMGDPGERESSFCFDASSVGENASCAPSIEGGLGPGEFLTHDAWKGGGLAQPTDVWQRHRLIRDGDVYAILDELWHDCDKPGHARVELSSGMIAARPTSQGSLVLLRRFYKGQSFPAIARGIVRSRTKSYYERLAEKVRELAPKWEPD